MVRLTVKKVNANLIIIIINAFLNLKKNLIKLIIVVYNE